MRGRDTTHGGDEGRGQGPPPSFGHEPEHPSEAPIDPPAGDDDRPPARDDSSERASENDRDRFPWDFRRSYAPPRDPGRDAGPQQGHDPDDEAEGSSPPHLKAVPPGPFRDAGPQAREGEPSPPGTADGGVASTLPIQGSDREAGGGGSAEWTPLPRYGPPLPPSQASRMEGPPPPRHGRRTNLLTAVAAAVAIVVLAGGALAGYAYIRGDQSPSGSGSAPHATSSPRVSTTPETARIDSVAADPKPLTLPEAFPASAPVVGGDNYNRVRQLLNRKCAKAAQPGFGEVLRRAGCLRVLRATYVDGPGRYAVTIGVAVLPTKGKARQVVRQADPSHYVWFRPLPGPPASGSARIGRSGGYAAIVPVGHYVAFSFAAHTKARPPKPDDHQLNRRSDAMRTYVLQPLLKRAMPR